MAVEVHSSGRSIKSYREEAKRLAKSDGIPLHVALDRMAQKFHEDGVPSWVEDKTTLKWSDLAKGVWKLGDDNILRRRDDNILRYPEGSAPSHETPIFVRHEIENPMLTDSQSVIEGLRTAVLSNKVTMRSRIIRWVECDGTLVERQVVGKSGECFDKPPHTWRYATKCDCCLRHEIDCDEGSALSIGPLLRKALMTGTKTDISCFSVATFDLGDRDPVPRRPSGTGWITPSPEAEKIMRRLYRRYDLRDELEQVS
ncbi:hypothetical protein SAMN05421853_12130 [Roseivivax halotolerans]|uniref:Uncharacterized protein n=1 Tax=Roseivivax halotolerans TaxID=93684 RepID=A0A1I6AJ02_9RHOB|nr:hypothetical protein [Roseivivax halotolerans]SFQ68650.1 hypothetical protein SAMN05421853_12130 [Roseivivax halotolerans]